MLSNQRGLARRQVEPELLDGRIQMGRSDVRAAPVERGEL